MTKIGGTRFNDQFFSKFESNTRHIFQTIWESCSEEEQTLLMLIVLRLHKNKQFDLSGIDLIFTQRERELNSLEEQGIIIHKTNLENKRLQNVYSFTSSLMERFVIQEIWNTENSDIQKRQKIFLKLMSHEQVEKVTRFTNWLWQNKNEVFSAVEVSGRLLGGLP